MISSQRKKFRHLHFNILCGVRTEILVCNVFSYLEEIAAPV
jgi:hypothetical protein